MLHTLALGFWLAMPAGAAAPAYHDASPAECEAYAAYLDKNFKPSKNDGPLARKAILIENEALDAAFPNRRAWERYLLQRASGPGRAGDACMAAFLARPEQALRFFTFPATRHPLRLVRSDELSKALAQGWDRFYEAYPGANGFLSFGVMALAPAGDEALFTVRNQCGRRCGYRDLVYMRKVEGDWHVVLKESLP